MNKEFNAVNEADKLQQKINSANKKEGVYIYLLLAFILVFVLII